MALCLAWLNQHKASREQVQLLHMYPALKGARQGDDFGKADFGSPKFFIEQTLQVNSPGAAQVDKAALHIGAVAFTTASAPV